MDSALERTFIDSQQANLWSKADFLDRARELKRRLEIWPIDGNEPVYCPREIVAFQTAIKSVFRNRVMLGEHDPHPTFTTQSIVGNSFIRNPKDPYAKWITIWNFRDFVEHLADAGDSEQAKLIRLTIARLLDSPMHSRARSQVFGDYVAGCDVDSSLLKDFLDAVTDFAAPVAPAKDAEQNRESDVVSSTVEGVLRAGMANVFNVASRASAVVQCNAAMVEHLIDKTNAELKLSDWVKLLNRAKKTIVKTTAWKVVIPNMKTENEAQQRAKALPLSGETVSKKVS